MVTAASYGTISNPYLPEVVSMAYSTKWLWITATALTAYWLYRKFA
jgi:hypothetical protein